MSESITTAQLGGNPNVPKPSLGRIVLVKTPYAINGQLEHAAMIVQVWSDTCINVQIFPGFGAVQCLTSVNQHEDGVEREYSWRWPLRG